MVKNTHISGILLDVVFYRVGTGHSPPPEAVLAHLEAMAFGASVPKPGVVLPVAGITHRIVHN
jgi:hypothetical protein